MRHVHPGPWATWAFPSSKPQACTAAHQAVGLGWGGGCCVPALSGEGRLPGGTWTCQLPLVPPLTHTHTHTRMHTQHTRMHTCPSSVLHVDLPTPPRTPLTHAHAACPSFLCLVVLHSDWRGRANSCGRDSPTLQLHPGLFSVLGWGGGFWVSLSLCSVCWLGCQGVRV